MPHTHDHSDPWQRAEDADAFVPVSERVSVEGEQIEIVKSYADCALTAVFWRNKPGSLIYPRALEPSEVVGGGSGGVIDDLYVMYLPPVLPHRKQIAITFDRRAASWEATPVWVPVDRRRTAAFDRFLAPPVAPTLSSGVRASVVAVEAGLIRAAAELLVEAVDENILAVELDPMPFRPYMAAGPGPAALWRDWQPPVEPSHRTVFRREGSRVTASARAEVTVQARQLSPEERAELPPPREPPPAWRATALPGGQPLAVQGSSGRGGPPPDHPVIEPILYFDAPPSDAEAIAVSLDQLWAYRYAHASKTIPSPRPDREVSLGGIRLEAEGCQIELLQWDAAGYEFTLRARCTPPDLWPDIRVLAGDRSASLWCPPPDNGALRLGLPLSHAALFNRPEVELVIRMVARRLPPVAITLPLTQS